MANVGFIGTGLLGSGMVEGMLRRGDRVVVWNRTESKARALEKLGAQVAASPTEAVADAERVHMTLPDDAVVDEIVAAFQSKLRRNSVVIDHSTTAPAATKARVERLRGRTPFVHAPVFMSPQMARDSVGLMMVSGPQAVYESVRDPLAKMTGDVWYVGEAGDGAAAYKIFGNSMMFVIAAGLSDVFAMAKNLGMTPADAMQVFAKFQPGNIIKARGEKMARGDFQATFELTMARKDLQLMIEAAGAQPMVVFPAIADRMDRAIAEGRGKQDLGVIAAAVVQ